MDVQSVLHIIGNILIGCGIAFMFLGAVSLFRFKDFYPRILIASKIDTVGLLTLLGGIALQNGFSFFTDKVMLLVIIILVLNPLVAHIVTGAAYRVGYQVEGTMIDEGLKDEDMDGDAGEAE